MSTEEKPVTVRVHIPARTGDGTKPTDQKWSGRIECEGGAVVDVVDAYADVPVNLLGHVLSSLHGSTVVEGD